MSQHNHDASQNLPASRFHESHAPLRLIDGIGVSGSILRRCSFEDTGGPFFLNALKRQVGMIEDDQALWFETTGGLVIVLGCCHAGIVNSVGLTGRASSSARAAGMRLSASTPSRLHPRTAWM